MLNQNLKLPWEHDVLALTKTHALVYIPVKEEWVAYSHNNLGDCYTGFYTRDKEAAFEDFCRRAGNCV